MAGVTQVVSASPGTKPDPLPPREVLWLLPHWAVSLTSESAVITNQMLKEQQPFY